EGVEDRELHAVVGGQAHHVDLGDRLRLQVLAEPGRAPAAVVEEAGVGVDRPVGALGEDAIDRRPLEAVGELGPAGPLDAVHRPEHLREAVEVDHLAGRPPGVLGRER
ncbi:hypothetical protein RZS08_64305, partial [Arthrospira platensis SPKY1]|nr:hypothetical protein [Arthrospira platensis SPKY1]